jgi:hypothetical protein
VDAPSKRAGDDDEQVYCTQPISNFHHRLSAASRTRCGLKAPDAVRDEGDAASVVVSDWEWLRCYQPASRARWQPLDRDRELQLDGLHANDFRFGAREIWQNRRGADLIRRSGLWELRRFRPGASGHYDTWWLEDGRRPRLRPPTAWANRTLFSAQPSA